MSTFIRSSFNFVQNHSFNPITFFQNNVSKHAKVAAIALFIFGALSTVGLIAFHCFKKRKFTQHKSPHHHKIPLPKSPSPQNAKDDLAAKQKEAEDKQKAAEAKKKLEAEAKKKLEDEKKAAAEKKKLEDEKKAAEAKKKLEDEKKAAAEKKKLEDEEAKKKADAERKAKEDLAAKKIEKPVEQPKKANPVESSPYDQVEKMCGEVTEKVFLQPQFSVEQLFASMDKKTFNQTLNTLNELVTAFEKQYYISSPIAYGSSVPAYFAQVSDGQSEAQRKYLSLVGIRNMLKYGPSIVDDFRSTLFLGGEHHYSHGKGLHKFKTYTGTVVDLDTEIDAKNDDDANQKAKDLIVQFGKLCGFNGLSAEEVASKLPHRKLDLQIGYVHNVGQSNTDRSNHGAWKRLSPNGFKTHYFVNVPNHEVVLLATLRFPYLIAELVEKAKSQNNGKLDPKFVDAFFNQGLSTMCFNDKIRVFMNFYHEWMGKFSGAQSPEAEAKIKIQNGGFGPVIQKQNADQLVKNALTLGKFRNLFEELRFDIDDEDHTSDRLNSKDEAERLYDFNVKGQTCDQWINEHILTFIDILTKKGLWENSLYRTDENSDFFVLDMQSLVTALKGYYSYLITF